jgi:hypothetical protein
MTTPDPTILNAPWPSHLVERLNLHQTGLDDWPSHPYTCANRGDGKHGHEAGDLGVLIATEQGWVCPHCDYTQTWAHAMHEELRPVAILGADQAEILTSSRQQLLERSDTLLPAYRALSEGGARGADVMLESILTRQRELLAPQPALTMWVVYDRPSDFPTEAIARRFDMQTQRPTEDTLRAPSLEALRGQLPSNATVLPRQPGDDPVIVECWLVESA